MVTRARANTPEPKGKEKSLKLNIEFAEPPRHGGWHSVADSVVWVEKADKVTVSRTDTRRGRKKDVKLVFSLRVQDNVQSDFLFQACG